MTSRACPCPPSRPSPSRGGSSAAGERRRALLPCPGAARALRDCPTAISRAHLPLQQDGDLLWEEKLFRGESAEDFAPAQLLATADKDVVVLARSTLMARLARPACARVGPGSDVP